MLAPRVRLLAGLCLLDLAVEFALRDVAPFLDEPRFVSIGFGWRIGLRSDRASGRQVWNISVAFE